MLETLVRWGDGANPASPAEEGDRRTRQRKPTTYDAGSTTPEPGTRRRSAPDEGTRRHKKARGGRPDGPDGPDGPGRTRRTRQRNPTTYDAGSTTPEPGTRRRSAPDEGTRRTRKKARGGRPDGPDSVKNRPPTTRVRRRPSRDATKERTRRGHEENTQEGMSGAASRGAGDVPRERRAGAWALGGEPALFTRVDAGSTG